MKRRRHEPETVRVRQRGKAHRGQSSRTSANSSAAALLAALVESSGEAIISHASDGTIISWNSAAEHLFGYTKPEIIGRSIATIFPPKNHKNNAELHFDCMRRGLTERFETSCQRKEGSVIQVSLSLSPIRDRMGRMMGTSVIARDISLQKQREESAREHEQARALDDFFDASPLGLIFVDPAGRVERVNPAQLEMIGRKGETGVGQPIADWFVEPELALNVTGLLRARNIVKNLRGHLLHSNGSTVHVLIDAHGLWRDDTFRYSRWFVRDITHRISLQQEVLRAVDNEQLRFGQDLHDDLCQQLTGIEFLCQRLAGERKLVSVAARARVLEIAEYLRGTIDHARELARGLSPVIAEGGNLLLALSSLADRTRKIFRCECEFRCDPPIALENAVVSSQLYRIVQEAVSNALHHGRARRVEIELSGANGELLLQILDNGIGLRQKPKKNPGMGLRIMSHRAEMIGASLAVQPRKNGGTEVICVLSRDNHKPILTGKTK